MCQLNTWSIVNRDKSKDQSAILHSTWVYKIKRLPSGLIDKFKARLCARGDLQQHGLNYSKTYSPAVQWSTVRLCLILAHKFNLLTHQCDYSNAYCQSPLTEELYMEIPPRYCCDVRTKKFFAASTHESVDTNTFLNLTWHCTAYDRLVLIGSNSLRHFY